MIKAEIVRIGTELLTGQVLDPTTELISRKLGGLGCAVQYSTRVGNYQKDIEGAIRHAFSRASVIILSGGLDSGSHSVTRKAIGRVVGRRPVLMGDRGQNRPENPRKMTLVPNGARLLSSPDGSAQGFVTEWESRLLIALPAPSDQVEALFDHELGPYLMRRLKRRSVIRTLVLRTVGISDSEIRERIKDLIPQSGTVFLSVSSMNHEVAILIRCIGRTQASVDEVLSAYVDKITERLGDSIYGRDEDSLEAVVGSLLKRLGFSLSVAESCTGGLIGDRLTNVPGSSDYLEEVQVSYSNRSKTVTLGVDQDLISRFGAVSPEVARAMAVGIRNRARTDIGLSCTGIAGPSGGTLEKPVGLVHLAVADHGQCRSFSIRFEGNRKSIKFQASQKALDLLRHYLHSCTGIRSG